MAASYISPPSFSLSCKGESPLSNSSSLSFSKMKEPLDDDCSLPYNEIPLQWCHARRLLRRYLWIQAKIQLADSKQDAVAVYLLKTDGAQAIRGF